MEISRRVRFGLSLLKSEMGGEREPGKGCCTHGRGLMPPGYPGRLLGRRGVNNLCLPSPLPWQLQSLTEAPLQRGPQPRARLSLQLAGRCPGTSLEGSHFASFQGHHTVSGWNQGERRQADRRGAWQRFSIFFFFLFMSLFENLNKSYQPAPWEKHICIKFCI